jgi:hypothetical protein
MTVYYRLVNAWCAPASHADLAKEAIGIQESSTENGAAEEP